MSERPTDPTHPVSPAEEPTPAKPEQEITTGRRALWVIGGGVGAYMILRGVWALATGGGDDQP